MGNSNSSSRETYTLGKYNVVGGFGNQFNICFMENRTDGSTNWQAANPLFKLLPNFMLQLGILILLTRVFIFVLKPLRQPRFVSEILVGIVLGPTLLSRIAKISEQISPFEGVLLLETMGNLGITFYMFLVGLEMDISPILRMGKKAWSVSIGGVIVPACAGIGIYEIVKNAKPEAPGNGGIFWAIALTVTSFPDLARMLSNLKLIYTDLGKTALTSAIFTDLISWFLLVAAVSLVNSEFTFLMILPPLLFVAITWLVIRPLIFWTIDRITSRSDELSTMEGQYGDMHVCIILTGVLLCGFITEMCGVHSMFGAFMFGLMIPNGELGTKIMEKIEASVVGIMLPPVFLITGIRTNFSVMFSVYGHGLVLAVILVAIFIKVITTLLVCLYLKCSFRDSLALGVLMNTKGVLAIIVLNEGRGMKVFDQQTFSWMILSILIMTASVGPIVGFTHRSTRHLKQYHRRKLEGCKLDEELRVLACLHSSRNRSGLISVLHYSTATISSPITVFAVHLVELTGSGRASTMLIFHDKNMANNVVGNNIPNPTREQADEEQIISAFQLFQNENNSAHVQLLTAVSSYATMHEDVSNFALDKRVTVILLPFHKKPNGLGGWTDENVQHKQVCENLLANAPCSVGILVDRGLTRHLPLESQHDHMRKCRVAMLFVQGPDDREALAYARRMAGNPGVLLTVLRFVPGKELQKSEERPAGDVINDDDYDDDELFSSMFEKEKEKEKLLDDDYINEFRFRTMHDHSISYMEKPVNSGDQIVVTIRSGYNDFDLYIVGRGDGRQSPLTFGLSEWSDCPELGVVGETLASADFLTSGSVLVMQQSAPTGATSVSKKKMSSGSKKGVSENGSGSVAEVPFVNHKQRDDIY